MLTKDISVNVVLADVVVFRKSGTQTRRIQNRAGTDNPVFRQTGKLVERIGQDIDRIRNDDIRCIRGIFCDFRNDHLCDIDV